MCRRCRPGRWRSRSTRQTWLLERNPVFLGGRHRRQPVALHRQGAADARREPRGHQPARHRRRVRLHGALHRSGEAAGVPRERRARPLQGASRSRLQRRGLRAEVQFRLHGRPRDPEMVRQSSISAARWRSASTASRSTRRSSSASAHRARRSRPISSRKAPGKEWRKRWATLDVNEGQRDARRDRPEQEGRRGLSAAHRQWPAAAAADRRRADAVADLAAAGRDDRPAMAGDRHLRPT